MTLSTAEPARVLITGGAGFLARAIYRYCEAAKIPWRFTAMSRDDSKHTAVMNRFPAVQCIRGDVTGAPEWLASLFSGHDAVIHAAAVKYVDRAESNVIDTIRVNVTGSQNVALAAALARVQVATAISTDKAVRPANVYGMTKALMERLWIEMARHHDATRFTLCRYGNVVGSTGSVIPMWQQAIAAGQPIRVTDPMMTRFFMSPTFAVETVLRALTVEPGRIVFPIMGAMKMGDVAYSLLGTDDRTRLITVGSRPGEKGHELLVTAEEVFRSVAIRHDFGVIDPPWYGSAHRPPGLHFDPVVEHSSEDARRIDGAALRDMIRDAEGV